MLKAFSVSPSVSLSRRRPSNPSEAGFREKLSSKGAPTPRCRPLRVLTQTRAQTNTFLEPRSGPVVFIPARGCSVVPLAVWSQTTSRSAVSLLELLAGDKAREFRRCFSPSNMIFVAAKIASGVFFSVLVKSVPLSTQQRCSDALRNNRKWFSYCACTET